MVSTSDMLALLIILTKSVAIRSYRVNQQRAGLIIATNNTQVCGMDSLVAQRRRQGQLANAFSVPFDAFEVNKPIYIHEDISMQAR
jgi:hypothetical protein